MNASIKVEILKDSISPKEERLTTFRLIYPRIIHKYLLSQKTFNVTDELRDMSYEDLSKETSERPFIPSVWKKQKPQEFFDQESAHQCWWALDRSWGYQENAAVKATTILTNMWMEAKNEAVYYANYLHELGVDADWCTHLLEPFIWQVSIVSSTSFTDFLKRYCPRYQVKTRVFRSRRDVRNHYSTSEFEYKGRSLNWWMQHNQSDEDMQLQLLAEAMYDALSLSKPKKLKEAEWHTPDLNRKNDFSHQYRVMREDEWYLFSRGQDGGKDHEHGWCNGIQGFLSYNYQK